MKPNFWSIGRSHARHSALKAALAAPTWCLAHGAITSVRDEIIWRDDRITVIAPSQLAVSSNRRYVIVGSAWLPERVSLLNQLNVDFLQPPSDLQLVADLWEQHGPVWSLLSGAFSLAVWDRDKQELWIGRDRSGIQTVYYTCGQAVQWVASKPQNVARFCSSNLDLVALRDYLCCAFVPGERTLYQQIREVRPGTIVQLPGGFVQPYWQLQEQITEPEQPLAWHGDRLRSLLNQVVQEYLPASEPVGSFLSGGLDSSCVTALAAKLHDAPVHTYSIHFGNAYPNELEFSSLVAQHCRTQHHILEISFPEMWQQLPATMACLDDPIGDPLTVPNLLLAKLAAESVQVVLNGEGGDPCFGGPKNQPMLINQLYGSVTDQPSLQAYLTSFQKCALDLPQLLKPEIWSLVQSEPSVFTADLASSTRYLNRLMALNIKFKGADHILTKVNNLMGPAGIAGRSPLFDSRVVDMSMQIPPEHKLSGVQEKAVLKQAVADLLPEAIIQRPKSGMMVPVQLGFRKFWNRPARELLLSRRAAIAPYLNQALIRSWLDYQGDTWNRYGVKLWLLVSLELWLQASGVR